MMQRSELIEQLVSRGVPKGRASIYADAFLAYREAQANIQEHGIIVAHPRTGNPITNPYLDIRDRAARRLESMRKIGADFLW